MIHVIAASIHLDYIWSKMFLISLYFLVERNRTFGFFQIQTDPSLNLKKWLLKECDINKDMAIDGLAHITFPDMQIPLFEKAIIVPHN